MNNLIEIPNEILLQILSRVDAKGVMNCMKVCRRLRSLINDHWFRLPRPLMELRFGVATKARSHWRLDVTVNMQEHTEVPSTGIRKFLFVYESQTLIVEWMRNCRELEKLRASLGNKGFLVSSLSSEDALEMCLQWLFEFRYRLSIQLQDSTDVTLAMKVRKIVMTHPYKLEKLITYHLTGVLDQMLSKTQDQEVRFYRETDTPHRTFAFVVQMTDLKPYNCRSATSTAHEQKPAENVIYRFLRTAALFLRRYVCFSEVLAHVLEETDRIPAHFLNGPNYVCSKMKNALIISTYELENTLSQRVIANQSMKSIIIRRAHFTKNYMFGAEGRELFETVEVTNAKVMRIEVNRNTIERIPEVLGMLVKQWNDGLRVIKSLTVDPADVHGKPYEEGFSLDVMNIFSEYSPERLAKSEDSAERFIIHSTTIPVKHLFIQKQIITRDKSIHVGYYRQRETLPNDQIQYNYVPYFGYVFTEWVTT